MAALAVAVSVLILASPAARAAGDDDIKVNIGIASAKPGDPIDVPVTLSAGENAQIGGLVSHITFPKAILTYTDVEKGLAADLADAETKGSVSDDKDDASLGVLELTVAGKNPIKPGILAYLKFTVSEKAQKGNVALKVKDMKATAPDGKPMELAKGDDGEITLFAIDETIPVVGCFFFTH